MPPKKDLSGLVDVLKEQIAAFAKASFKKYADEAKNDGLAFLESMQEKLLRWTGLLASGDLTTEDFEWLVNSQRDLVAMRALHQAGLAAIRVDQFKSGVLNIIVDTVFSYIKI